jgi:hypothetical protein
MLKIRYFYLVHILQLSNYMDFMVKLPHRDKSKRGFSYVLIFDIDKGIHFLFICTNRKYNTVECFVLWDMLWDVW